MASDLVLVTGGGTGIGFGIAQALVDSGYRVLIAGRREAVLEEAAAALGDQASWVAHDLDRLDAAAGFVARCESAHGPIAALVNNAGRHFKAPTVSHPLAEFAAVLHTNVTAVFALTQAVAARMLERRNGSIVMISSMTSQVGLPEVAAYASSKAALLGLVRTCAVEWGGAGVRVNVVCPGFVETEIFKRVAAADPKRIERVLARIPAGRPGKALEIGDAVKFLCSPDSRYVTGAVINVDGGYSIGF